MLNNHTFTRRSFVKTSALGALALTSAGLLGACSPQIPTTGSDEVDENLPEQTTDLLIIGGGIAGMCAALSARDEGVEHVTIIEKQDKPGGSAWNSLAGIVVDAESTPAGVDDSITPVLDKLKAQQEFSERESSYPNYDRVEYIFGETGKTYDFLKEHGVAVNPVTTETELLKFGFAFYDYNPDNTAYVTTMIDAVEGAGVEIITDCAAEELIVDNGKVVGAVVSEGRDKSKITASTVVLATGGFGSNPDMVAKYVPEAAAFGLTSLGNPGATGEGMQMAYDIGAAGFDDYWVMMATIGLTFSDDIVRDCKDIGALNLTRKTKQNVIVNSKGDRFVSEDVPDQSVIMNSLLFDGNGPFYMIYANPETDLQTLFDAGVEGGSVLKADTPEELQELLNAPNFAATMAKYNEYCANGVDEDLDKPAENLVTMESGPYYALEIGAKMIGTMGGVKTNEKMQVMNENGQPIEGLLAAGEVTNRDLYNQMYLGGVSIGCYTTMGRLAGITASETISA